MRPRIYRRPLTGLAILPLMLLPLAACSSDDDFPAPASDVQSSASSSAGTIPDALSRISADALVGPLYLEAGDTAAIRELSSSDPDRWTILEQGIGYTPIQVYAGTLSLQPDTVTYAATVGNRPAGITLVHGEIDVEAIVAGAEELGFEGDGDQLTAAGVKAQTIAEEIVLNEEDAVFAGASADVGWIDGDGDSIMDDESVADFISCLDGSVAVLISDEHAPAGRVAVGVQEESGARIAVICAEGGQATATAIEDDITDGLTSTTRPYADYFGEPVVTVVDGDLAQVIAPISDDAPTMTPFNMLLKLDLPGLK